MDARLLVAVVIAGFLILSWLVHRFVEAPTAGVPKRGLDTSFARLRNASAQPPPLSWLRRHDLAAEAHGEVPVEAMDQPRVPL